MPDVRGDFAHGRLLGKIEAATDAGETQVIKGKLAGVINEVCEGIVAGIDGPDDFVERLDGLASGGGNLANTLGGFVRLGTVLASKFAEQGYLGEVRAEVVVDVFGNASAFFVENGLLFEFA